MVTIGAGRSKLPDKALNSASIKHLEYVRLSEGWINSDQKTTYIQK
jgi:hypothetical protein